MLQFSTGDDLDKVIPVNITNDNVYDPNDFQLKVQITGVSSGFGYETTNSSNTMQIGGTTVINITIRGPSDITWNSLTPKIAPTDVATMLTIRGEGFLQQEGYYQCDFGNDEKTNIEYLSLNELRCYTPSSWTQANKRIKVAVVRGTADQNPFDPLALATVTESTAELLFAQYWTEATTYTASAGGGDMITIRGVGFLASDQYHCRWCATNGTSKCASPTYDMQVEATVVNNKTLTCELSAAWPAAQLGTGALFWVAFDDEASYDFSGNTSDAMCKASSDDDALDNCGRSNNRHIFMFEYGWTSYTPAEYAATGTAKLQVSGRGFLACQAPAVCVFGDVTSTATKVSDTNITCVTPVWSKSKTTQSPDFSITCNGKVLPGPAGTQRYLFKQPIIYEISPTETPPAGAMLTINGSYFGGGVDKPALTIRIGETACLQPQHVSDTTLTCKVAPGVRMEGVLLDVVVTLGERTVTLPASFQYALAVIYRVIPIFTPYVLQGKPGADPGPVALIEGGGFGTTFSLLEASIGETACSETTWFNDSAVLCKLPQALVCPERGPLRNSALGVTVTSIEYLWTAIKPAAFSYAAPTVTSVHPPRVPTANSATITLLGQNFGFQHVEGYIVSVGATECGSVQWVSDQQVTCKVEGGIGSDLAIGLSLEGCDFDQTARFAYQVPNVTEIRPPTGALTGATRITVIGNNFGSYNAVAQGQSAPTITVGGRACEGVTWISDSSISCHARAPFNLGTPPKTVPVRVTIAGQIDGSSAGFRFLPDLVFDRIDFSGSTLYSGTRIRILGQNFGNADLTPVAMLGGTVSQSTIWESSTSIAAVIPPGVGGASRDIALQIGDLKASFQEKWRYSPPKVTMAGPEGLVIGDDLLIEGMGFGGYNTSPLARVGATICLQTIWHNDSAVVCKAPGGTGVDHRIVVVVSASTCVVFS